MTEAKKILEALYEEDIRDPIEIERAELRAKVDDAEKAWRDFYKPHQQPNGLVPDNIRKTSNFQKLKKTFDVAFKRYQDFNKENKSGPRRKYPTA